jgi:hypothetical protein
VWDAFVLRQRAPRESVSAIRSSTTPQGHSKRALLAHVTSTISGFAYVVQVPPEQIWLLRWRSTRLQ